MLVLLTVILTMGLAVCPLYVRCHNIHILLHGIIYRLSLYSYANPSVSFIHQSRAIRLWYIVQYAWCSTVCSASSCTLQWTQKPMTPVAMATMMHERMTHSEHDLVTVVALATQSVTHSLTHSLSSPTEVCYISWITLSSWQCNCRFVSSVGTFVFSGNVCGAVTYDSVASVT
jgi:hypothetical protein